MPIHAPTSLAALQEFVREHEAVRVCGAGTKSALSAGATVSTRELHGLVDYDPQELTITVLAGTRVADVDAWLAAHGQYLPCEPPFDAAGATVGGSVAAGLSGSARYRYGGLRDFLIAVRFVDATGAVVRGGARVVKNAAGFDLPKLMVGSQGVFGVLTEASFKVFPRPPARATLLVGYASDREALAAFSRLSLCALDVECLDWLPGQHVAMRVAGRAEALPRRLERIAEIAEGRIERLDADEDESYWRAVRSLVGLETAEALLKMALRPSEIAEVERDLVSTGAAPYRRYVAGGHQAWIGWDEGRACARGDAHAMARWASRMTVLRGRCPWARQAAIDDHGFGARVKRALDPTGKFLAGPAGGDARDGG